MGQGCLLMPNAKFSDTNTLFQLFHINAIIFLVLSGLTFTKQYFGSPIDCIYDGILDQHKSFVDNYCWKNYESLILQSNSVFNNGIFLQKQPVYRLWLPLILLFQALLAYIPSWLWNNLLRDKRLCETISSIKDPLKQHSRRKLLIINLANDLFTEVIQRRYAKPFFFTEILNVICFVLNLLSINLLFDNEFALYGFREIGMSFGKSATSANVVDHFEVFPVFGKCSVQVSKRENEVKKEEAICMIPFNSLCESIFMFLWVWFSILITATLCGIIYRIVMLLSRRKRKKLLLECVDKTFENKILTICEKLSVYSWFNLYRISRNVDPLTFQDILSALLARLDSMPVFKVAKTAKNRIVEHDSTFVASKRLNSVTVTVV